MSSSTSSSSHRARRTRAIVDYDVIDSNSSGRRRGGRGTSQASSNHHNSLPSNDGISNVLPSHDANNVNGSPLVTISDEHETLINTAIRFVVLNTDLLSKGIVTRGDVSKYLQDSGFSLSKQVLALIMDELKLRLANNFGYQLIESTTAYTYYIHNMYTLADINMDLEEQLKQTIYSEENLQQNALDNVDTQIEELNLAGRSERRARRRERHRRQLEKAKRNSIAGGNDDEDGDDDDTNHNSSIDDDNDDDDDDDDYDDDEPVLEQDEQNNGDSLLDLTHDDILEHSKRALLMLCLAFIQMNEDPLPEMQLFELLKMAKLPENYPVETHHDIGTQKPPTLKKVIIEEFTRKHYLKRTKVLNKNNRRGGGINMFQDAVGGGENGEQSKTYYQFEWGDRAYLEFKQTEILQFVKDIWYGNIGRSRDVVNLEDEPVGSGDIMWWRFTKQAQEKDEKREQTISDRNIKALVHKAPSSVYMELMLDTEMDNINGRVSTESSNDIELDMAIDAESGLPTVEVTSRSASQRGDNAAAGSRSQQQQNRQSQRRQPLSQQSSSSQRNQAIVEVDDEVDEDEEQEEEEEEEEMEEVEIEDDDEEEEEEEQEVVVVRRGRGRPKKNTTLSSNRPSTQSTSTSSSTTRRGRGRGRGRGRK